MATDFDAYTRHTVDLYNLSSSSIWIGSKFFPGAGTWAAMLSSVRGLSAESIDELISSTPTNWGILSTVVQDLAKYQDRMHMSMKEFAACLCMMQLVVSYFFYQPAASGA